MRCEKCGNEFDERPDQRHEGKAPDLCPRCRKREAINALAQDLVAKRHGTMWGGS